MMTRCHVRLSGVGPADSLLRSIHGHEAALLPFLVPDGCCEALDVARVGDRYRVRARIRIRGDSVMWVQVEHRDVLLGVRDCFDVARRRLKRGRPSRPGVIKSPQRAAPRVHSAV